MTSRLLPVVLALGGAALLVFLGWLAWVFDRDDAQARALVSARARAVAQAGRALALEEVQAQQRRAQAQVLALEKNPLLDDGGLLFAIDGVQRLPVPWGPDSAARSLAQRLEQLALVLPGTRGTPPEGGSALSAQLEGLRAMRAALLAKDLPGATSRLEALLAADERRALTVQEDAAVVISALESWPDGAPLNLAEAALRGSSPSQPPRAPQAEASSLDRARTATAGGARREPDVERAQPARGDHPAGARAGAAAGEQDVEGARPERGAPSAGAPADERAQPARGAPSAGARAGAAPGEQNVERAQPTPAAPAAGARAGAALEGASRVQVSREPLQRGVLRLRAKLSFDDFALLCERLAALSRNFALEQGDFLARCRTVQVVPEVPQAPLREPMVVQVGQTAWLLEADENATLGIPLEVAALEAAAAQRLAKVGLLQPGETLRLSLGAPFAATDEADAVSPRGEVPLAARLESQQLAQQLERLAATRRLKQLLLAVCAALALGLAVGAVQQQRTRQRALQARAEFLAAVSHELKTPLAAVRLMAETLALRLQGTAAAKDYPARIVAEADALSALVENLLSFERIDKGGWAPRRRAVALAGWTAALEDEVARAGRAVHLEVSGFQGLTAELDGALVQLLLVNLVRNACRYAAREPVEVHVSAAREGPQVVFRVRDNGVGIAREDRQRIFEPFVRLAPTASTGTGLGLALAQRIARLHGGSLAVEASSHEGTTFVLRLVG